MNNHSFRSVPQQSRSQKTVDQILDTAAQLFVEVGYENTTTNAIAERAGISIGALYRYYPHKEAVLKSLVERYYRLEREIFEKTFVEDVKYLPPSLMLDRLIDPLLELHCAWPAYAHILLGTDVSVDIAAAACGSETDINEKLAEFFCLISPNLDHEQVLMAAVICKTSLKGLISLVVGSNDEKYRNQVILEYKKMMLAYLQPIFWPGINNPPS